MKIDRYIDTYDYRTTDTDRVVGQPKAMSDGSGEPE